MTSLNPQVRHWTATMSWSGQPSQPAPIALADTEQAAYEEAYQTLSRLRTGASDFTIEVFYDGELKRTQRLHRNGAGPLVPIA